MIRNGDYCLYKDMEYEFIEDMDGNLLIISEDSLLLNEGFIDKRGGGVYSKIVNHSELSNCYQISSRGKIKGELVNVSRQDGDKYFVGTSNSTVAQKLGLERTDKYYYDKWVPKSEVEIFEERKEINL